MLLTGSMNKLNCKFVLPFVLPIDKLSKARKSFHPNDSLGGVMVRGGFPLSASALAYLSTGAFAVKNTLAILCTLWVHCASSIKELTLESNGRRWLSRVSVSSSSGPSGLSKELEHKTEEEKEDCQANEKPNNSRNGRLSKGTRRICNK